MGINGRYQELWELLGLRGTYGELWELEGVMGINRIMGVTGCMVCRGPQGAVVNY